MTDKITSKTPITRHDCNSSATAAHRELDMLNRANDSMLEQIKQAGRGWLRRASQSDWLKLLLAASTALLIPLFLAHA